MIVYGGRPLYLRFGPDVVRTFGYQLGYQLSYQLSFRPSDGRIGKDAIGAVCA